MSFKGKPVRVIMTGDAKEEYIQLNKIVGDEVANGVKGTDHQTLLNGIKQKIKFLKDNPQHGVHIAKNKIPKGYVAEYDVENIWKTNLPGAWRMIYTIKGSEVDIIALILDMIDHKRYNKKFGYKN